MGAKSVRALIRARTLGHTEHRVQLAPLLTRVTMRCLNWVLVASVVLVSCNIEPVPSTIDMVVRTPWKRCALDSAFSNGVTVDYPMLSDTTFTVVIRSERASCSFNHVFPCEMPGVAIPRLIVRDSSWVFLEQGSGNYTRTLLAYNLEDCTTRYQANELVDIDTDRDLIALFVRASQDEPSTILLVNYAHEERGRVPLPGMLCAEEMACLDSAWFTASSLRVSYHQDPNGPSLITELPL